jgi:hypothetical protein
MKRFVFFIAVFIFAENHTRPAPVPGEMTAANGDVLLMREAIRFKDGGAALIIRRNGRYGYDGPNGWHGASKDHNGVWHAIDEPWLQSSPRSKVTPIPSNETKSAKTKPIEAASESVSRPVGRFDGTWIVQSPKSNSAHGSINGIYTLTIKDDKTATKTLDVTNVSSPESPFYASILKLRRKWTCKSIDFRIEGSSLTVEWSKGELSDWMPQIISRDEIESYGSPNAETSVYKLSGDQLTRVNDPNGVTYHRVK